ncbi:uncharacterized protein LOC131934545 [Physella acuta]|uniref:uncharacterized protein LOC131934545 n=1 Tax=Physella acuta TaxID=109671 RepID=UPI0027DD883F|nr:uncharacterized protein LOC131934545 [Physella acuta]
MAYGEWDHGLFGCLSNPFVCIMAYLLPCYVFGQLAYKNDRSCLKYGVLFFCPVVNCVLLYKFRMATVAKKDIKTTCLPEALKVGLCTCCAMVQQATEEMEDPKAMDMGRS